MNFAGPHGSKECRFGQVHRRLELLPGAGSLSLLLNFTEFYSILLDFNNKIWLWQLAALTGDVPAINQCEMSIEGYDNATIAYCQAHGSRFHSKSTDFALTIMNFVVKMMNFVLKNTVFFGNGQGSFSE